MITITQGFEHSEFFRLHNDYAGYIDFSGMLIPTDTDGGREVGVIVSFELDDQTFENDDQMFENDHSKPPTRAYMTLYEHEFANGVNCKLSGGRHIPLTVSGARNVLKTWGGVVETK